MARGRMLSKSLSTSQKFAKLSDVSGKLTEFTQSLYPLINAHADDFGRLAGDPFTVKHVCHPTSPRKVAEFAMALQHLDDVGLIRWYEVDGCSYIQIVKFDDHQTGLHKRTTSRIPECPKKNVSVPDVQGSSGKSSDILGQEKRRELNGREENLTEKSVSSEPDGSQPPSSVLTFETVGPQKAWSLTAEQITEWTDAYPGLDVLAEARKALAWLRANPGKRKTASGMPAFCVRWLSKAVNDNRSPQDRVSPQRPFVPGVEETRRLLS